MFYIDWAYIVLVLPFVIFSMIFTVFEYLVSLVFELIFNIRWWDYSNELLNLNINYIGVVLS